MRSFKEYIDSRNNLSLLLILLLVLISSGIMTANLYLNRMEDQYRQALGIININIRHLNGVKAGEPYNISYQKLTTGITQLDDILTRFPLVQDLSPEITNLSGEINKGADPDYYIGLLGDLARSVGDHYHKRANFFTNLALIALLALTLFAGFLVFSLRQVNHNFKHFFKVFHQGIANLDAVLDFKNPAPLKGDTWEEERQFLRAVNKSIDRIHSDRIIANLANQRGMEDILPTIFEGISKEVRCDRIGLAFIDQFNNVIAESAYLRYHEIHLDQGFTEPLANTTLSELTFSRGGRIINDLEEHYRTVNKSLSTKLILKEGIRSSITIPLFSHEQCHGFAFISSTDINSYSEVDKEYLIRFFNALAPSLLNKFIDQLTISSTASAFVKLMEKKDNETSLHINRMASYATVIAKELYRQNHPNVSHRIIREIALFAPLHDIGKIGIPDQVLLKEGPLSKEEFEDMKTHVTLGVSVMNHMHEELQRGSGVDYLSTAINIILGHHERYDGTGYPQGLSGDNIPMEGQICALADVFDALTSKRPYKEAWSLEKALAYVKEQRGKHFNPAVVDAFIEAFEDIKEIFDQYKEI